MSEYFKLVEQLRQAFPQPVSDRVHDAYFVYSIMRALDAVDKMKSVTPVLGKPNPLNFEAARTARVGDDVQELESVTGKLVDYLSGIFIWGHPRAQINVIPSPTIPSIIGGLLPSIYNPNLVSEESARHVSVAEVEVTAMVSDLIGYDPGQSSGVFTFGGTGTLLYAIKIGLEKAFPGYSKKGLGTLVTEECQPVIFCSDCAHYASKTVASWLGIGEQNVIEVPTSSDNEMQVCLLESMARDAIRNGRRVVAIIATMGTTDAFGLDDLKAIREVRDRLVDEFNLDYIPHLHGDAVIGWAWSVYNDYDFEANPLEFRKRTVRSLAGTKRRIKHLSLSDSIGIDFHKTGFTPYVSSLYVSADGHDLELIARDKASMPYLFKSGEHHPGRYSLETSRAGSGPLAALANLLLLGKNGLRSLLGHLVTMAETLAENLDGHESTTVLNNQNFGPVTLFRVYPEGVDTFAIPKRECSDPTFKAQLLEYNDYNRRIFAEIQKEALEGRGVVISMTDCYRETDYGEPIVALKSYIMSPFSDEQYIHAVLDSIWQAQAKIKA